MSSGMNKKEIVAALEEIAELLELDGGNTFKVRSYRVAAERLGRTAEDLDQLVAGRRLEALEGVGKAIATKIRTLASSGSLPYLDDLRAAVPAGVRELRSIGGLGPKRIVRLRAELGVSSIADLERALQAGDIGRLSGFGQRSEESLRAALAERMKHSGRTLSSVARTRAAELCARLEKIRSVQAVQVAGSLRRRVPDVKDIDLLVATLEPGPAHEALLGMPEVERILAQGREKSSVRLRDGLGVDLRTVRPEEMPFALQYFTGSKEHNVALRSLARRKGLKINEYGLFEGERSIPCRDEAALYEALGLGFIPPELREGRDEIELAAQGALPTLVEEADIKGVFHVHTTMSDGRDELADMVAEADRMGLQYIGISDHSPAAGYANGLSTERLRAQHAEIEALRERFPFIEIFHGVESDILADGSLDYPDDVLAELDFVIGSLHQKLRLPLEEQTDRLLRAMENPYLTFWGHPTARMMPGRAGVEVELERVLDRARECSVVVEVNGNPRRLDLDWRDCAQARKKGSRFGLHPDAHAVDELGWTEHSVGVARKAGLSAQDVLNTLEVDEIKEYLRSRAV